jgi:hypothetical protein
VTEVAGYGRLPGALHPAWDATQSPSRGSPWLFRTTECSLGVMLVLSPIQFLVLPANLAPVEVWNVATLPILWLFLVRSGRPVHVPYLTAAWLILLGSLLGTFSSVDPMGSFLALTKDTYLYVWFVSLAAVLSLLRPDQFRRVLLVALAVIVLHGLLVICQFLSAEIFRTSAELTARFGSLDRWRPSGLFENANSTALYQLMGLVPLLLLRLPRVVTSLLGLIIVGSVLATGSMAAFAGLVAGLLVVMAALSTIGGGAGLLARSVLPVAGLGIVLGLTGYVLDGGNSDILAQFQSVFYGRAETSAAGRFSLWERGLSLLTEPGFTPLGIGPDSYKDMDMLQKPLHNDLLSFLIERGFLGTFGLITLAATALAKAIRLVRRLGRRPEPADLSVLVLLGAIVAAMVHGQFHQVFHHRSLWLVLALQEACLLGTWSWRQHQGASPAVRGTAGISNERTRSFGMD